MTMCDNNDCNVFKYGGRRLAQVDADEDATNGGGDSVGDLNSEGSKTHGGRKQDGYLRKFFFGGERGLMLTQGPAWRDDGSNDCPENQGDGDPKPEMKDDLCAYVPPEVVEERLTTVVPTGFNFLKLDDIQVKVTGHKPPRPISSFEASGLRLVLVKNIEKSGYTKPTAVQKYSIPAILNRRDLMTCAQTGCGKIAAFMIPIIDELLINNDPPNMEDNRAHPDVLIMSPTTELAIQVGDQGKMLAYNSIVKVAVIYGGTSTFHQLCSIMRGCHILVATPGRLKDFVKRGYVSFTNVKYFILDHADRMQELGFLVDVEDMLNHRTMPPTGERQTLVFSAKFPQEIQEFVGNFLHNYIFLAVGDIAIACKDVQQRFFKVTKFEKKSKLEHILKETPNERTVIFVATKRTADMLVDFLCEGGIQAAGIHRDSLRERQQTLFDFKMGRQNVLIATKVGARGLDIKDVQHVINYDLPNSIDDYVRRIGRTGRVGNYDRATSFFDENQDRNFAIALVKMLFQANQDIPNWLRSYSGGEASYQFE